MGSEVLNGVLLLYHPRQPAPSSSSKLPAQTCNAIVLYNLPPHHHSGGRNRRRKDRDPSRPKPNRSGYNFFAEKHSKFNSLYPNREREFTKMLGGSWNNISRRKNGVSKLWGERQGKVPEGIEGV
ncbi:high mobility group B protein 9-like [Lycium barbarum]|uniref:high mobility group B protein 9-like n=1 Tax=Lycium barbarum TaxID=112863 RepID=UPI00293ED5DA|nr:high mobility group B protein 9-like [Lycium barbarum]